MIIGWAITFAISLLFALLPSINLTLASGLFLAMTVAYLCADCAADAALVGLSTREPIETRGAILSTAYSIRFSFNIVSAAIIAFLYNGPATCGDFDFGLTTQQLMWIATITIGLLMGCTLPFYTEEAPAEPPPSLSSRLGQFYVLLQQPAVWRLVLGLVCTTAFSLITNQAQVNANKEWFHIQPLQLGLSTCFQSLILALGTMAYKRYLLNVSWRKTYGAGIIGMQVYTRLGLLRMWCMLVVRVTMLAVGTVHARGTCDHAGSGDALLRRQLVLCPSQEMHALLSMCGTFEVLHSLLPPQVFNLLYLLTVYYRPFKDGWWYVFTQVDMEFAYAFTFVIGIIIVPEITQPGFEGVVYGAITTYSNM